MASKIKVLSLLGGTSVFLGTAGAIGVAYNNKNTSFLNSNSDDHKQKNSKGSEIDLKKENPWSFIDSWDWGFTDSSLQIINGPF